MKNNLVKYITKIKQFSNFNFFTDLDQLKSLKLMTLCDLGGIYANSYFSCWVLI